MARSRVLKPGFFKNEDLASLPYETRLCFAGLWTLADRAGRLEDRPLRIKAELFPYDAVDMDAMLAGLDAKGFIRRYLAENRRYIAIVKFTEHQSPHVKESVSTIPAPDKHQTSPVLAPVKPDKDRLVTLTLLSSASAKDLDLSKDQITRQPPKRVNGNGHQRAHDEEITRRAGALLEHYTELYTQLRKGAKTRLLHNSIEFGEACQLVQTWDDARLDKILRVILTTDDEFISRTDRAFKIVALKAAWADDRLRQVETS